MLWSSVSSTRAQRPRWTWSAISTPRHAAVRTARGLSHNSWDTRFGPRSARRTRTSSLVCASSAYRLTSHSHSPTQRCDGKACATRAAQSHSPNVAIVFIFSDLGCARSSSTIRRSACVVAPTFGRHVLLSTSSGHFNFLRFFLDIDLLFYTSTPVVSGGASVDFRPT